jgi:hypothetical protein
MSTATVTPSTSQVKPVLEMWTSKVRVKVADAAVLPEILGVLKDAEDVTIKYTDEYYELTFAQEQLFTVRHI